MKKQSERDRREKYEIIESEKLYSTWVIDMSNVSSTLGLNTMPLLYIRTKTSNYIELIFN